ncbi:unnamed protein product [Blepharisma stoltei]|uniref:RING-type domain-containing protein n=1 Tax=Blepharisma stoltei TaxID=1481888 RepID=A0AAU9JL06_9CILI|nr:unnamed protein product [Blepharisma stoltei]
MEGFDRSSLTKEQVLRVFQKYDSLLPSLPSIEEPENDTSPCNYDQNYNSEDLSTSDHIVRTFKEKYDSLYSGTRENQQEELSLRIQQLEGLLETEKVLKKVLEQKFELHKRELIKAKENYEKIKTEAENWKSMYEEASEDLQSIQFQLESANNMYVGRIAKLDSEIQELKSKAKSMSCEEEQLNELSITEIFELEKNLIDNLIKIQSIKEDKLQKKLREKNEGPLCVICREKGINIILKPCKHACLCSDCSLNVLNCPMCRANIAIKEKIFIAK